MSCVQILSLKLLIINVIVLCFHSILLLLLLLPTLLQGYLGVALTEPLKESNLDYHYYTTTAACKAFFYKPVVWCCVGILLQLKEVISVMCMCQA